MVLFRYGHALEWAQIQQTNVRSPRPGGGWWWYQNMAVTVLATSLFLDPILDLTYKALYGMETWFEISSQTRLSSLFKGFSKSFMPFKVKGIVARTSTINPSVEQI